MSPLLLADSKVGGVTEPVVVVKLNASSPVSSVVVSLQRYRIRDREEPKLVLEAERSNQSLS